MESLLNGIHLADCIKEMNRLPEGRIDLVFADPPFNIGYDYDVYQDRIEHAQYLAWSNRWISAVFRVLKPNGSFWLAIGDEYAAELKLESQKLGFHCRSWVIWYYTFGVNCSKKFSRSHAHLFHFVKDPQNFTFREDDPENRIPSARQLVYADKRANPSGRLPDDTWVIRPADAIGEVTADDDTWSSLDAPAPMDDTRTWALRPQDLANAFKASEDTWYFPRVAGTFKERAGFHGCQMPEQLLGRIIRTCSFEGEVVLDPFSGSATTVAVAKKLGRRFIAFDISDEYVKQGQQRLLSIRVGDRLDGSPEPLLTVPSKNARRRLGGSRRSSGTPDARLESKAAAEQENRLGEAQLRLTMRGVRDAFRLTYDGFSADRVVADPELNETFVEACKKLGLFGDARTWNVLLFRLRKRGDLAELATTQRTAISWEDCDSYLFASEIAWQTLLSDLKAESLDDILCDPSLAAEFDVIAHRFAPGFKSLDYRWAALKIRKRASVARVRGSILAPPARLGTKTPLANLDIDQAPVTPGVYLLSGSSSESVYVGETLSLRGRFARQFGGSQRSEWSDIASSLNCQFFKTKTLPGTMLAWQSCLVRKFNPWLNLPELRAAR